MDDWGLLSRRRFLQAAAIGGAAITLPLGIDACGSSSSSGGRLIDAVRDATTRLSPRGWRELLLAVSKGDLDISAADLAAELAKPIRSVDHSVRGFHDFATTLPARGIEPGRPGRSMLYHALASAAVVESGDGRPLSAFPTLAEIESVENYVYGVHPPTLDELHDAADGRRLGLAVFALDYRGASESVNGRNADLCFSRTGIARLGTEGTSYDAKGRTFPALDNADPFAFRTVSQRFAPYIAMQAKPDPDLFGPLDVVAGDGKREFWVPVHKLFPGDECIAGLDLEVDLDMRLVNEKLKYWYSYQRLQGVPIKWSSEQLEEFPFVIRDEKIGSLASDSELGSGLLVPTPHPFAKPASYRGEPLTFHVSRKFVHTPGDLYFTSGQVVPGPDISFKQYRYGSGPRTDRPTPEYINIRHRVLAGGTVQDLNLHPGLERIIHRGGYETQHYIDFAGEGSIQAHCPQLEGRIPNNLAAFALVAPPDFFPSVNQRDLENWWRTSVPAPIRAALWASPPFALSKLRMAGNITLPAGFAITDDTMTAVVSQPDKGKRVSRQLGERALGRYTGLPDAAAGIMDPGWDTSLGTYYGDPHPPVQRYMQGHGLGTPFIEDAKLCAALGAFWPGVSPDGARTFTPRQRGEGFKYPWPTIVPLTDEEIGIEPTESGEYMPWDGVRGPKLDKVDGREVVVYPDINRTDYLDTIDKLTAYLTSKIDLAETKARILAMESVYWSLGIHDPDFARKFGSKPNGTPNRRAVIEITAAKAAWAVLSFTTAAADDVELRSAEREAGARLRGPRLYRVVIYRPGSQSRDPRDIAKVLLEIRERVLAYTDGARVLLRRDGAGWQLDDSMPTS